MNRVLVLDRISSEGITPLLEATDIEVEQVASVPAPELISRLAGFQAVIVRSATTLTAEAIRGTSGLRAIGRAGVGVDNIDVAAATERGIPVFYSPFGNVNAAAEHTIALMLALARNVPRGDAGLRSGRWERSALTGCELGGKTLGLVGLGRVARIVARVATGLGMSILAHDPFLPAESFGSTERFESLDDMLPRCDWVSLHLPRNEETLGLFGHDTLQRMRRGAFLVNVARGGIIDQEALHAALVSGHLAGAGLDVFAEEPCTRSPLFELEQVVVTPHLGASTHEAQLNVARDVAHSLITFFRDGIIAGARNERDLRG